MRRFATEMLGGCWSSPWCFPAGDTIAAARLRSPDGIDGPPTEIVVRIGP